MLLKNKYIGVLFLALQSCNIFSKSHCENIILEKENVSGIIKSGVSNPDHIYSVKIELKGNLSQNIIFNEFELKKGKIDTVFDAQDHYSSEFYYDILNPNLGSGELDFCITFYY
jgi:hypothetical protein